MIRHQAFALSCISLFSTWCSAEFIDFESIPGYPQPYPDVPNFAFGARPLLDQLRSRGVRFGDADTTDGTSSATVLRFDPELAPFGAFGPPRSGNGALYTFPRRVVQSTPFEIRMESGMDLRFDTPVSDVSFWILVSPNDNSPINNIGVSFITGNQSQVDLSFFNISTTNWFQISLTSPDPSGISRVNLGPFIGGTLSQRPYALDDLSFTPIPSPAAAPAFLFASAYCLRRRR